MKNADGPQESIFVPQVRSHANHSTLSCKYRMENIVYAWYDITSLMLQNAMLRYIPHKIIPNGTITRLTSDLTPDNKCAKIPKAQNVNTRRFISSWKKYYSRNCILELAALQLCDISWACSGSLMTSQFSHLTELRMSQVTHDLSLKGQINNYSSISKAYME